MNAPRPPGGGLRAHGKNARLAIRWRVYHIRVRLACLLTTRVRRHKSAFRQTAAHIVPCRARPCGLTFGMSDRLGSSMLALPTDAARHWPCSAAATKRSILGWHRGPADRGCKLLIADYPPTSPQMVGSSSSVRLACSAAAAAAGGGAARRRTERWIDAGQQPGAKHHHHTVYTHNKPV